jgi:hypothetical protein
MGLFAGNENLDKVDPSFDVPWPTVHHSNFVDRIFGSIVAAPLTLGI